MVEIVPSATIPSTSVFLRRTETAQETIEARQRLADAERLVDEQRKEDRAARDIERADERRAVLDGLRADEFREIQRQRVIRDEFRDRQLVASQQAAAAQDDVELQRRVDRGEADLRALADLRQDRDAAELAIEDRERRLVEARRLEQESVVERRLFARVAPAEDGGERLALQRIDDRRAFLDALGDQAFAARSFDEAVFAVEPVLPGVEDGAAAVEARGGAVRADFESDLERRRIDRRLAEIDFQRQQSADLELSERRLATVGFNPGLPRGSIVNVLG